MPNIDLAKRRRIMRRSMKLGHCICDPKRACPCDVFNEQGICPCAGERPEPADISNVRLTELVHNAGCASKIAPADLERVLTRLPAVDDPNVLSGLPAGDDAGVYRLPSGECLVQTVDVFSPCVDDPHTFGRICAANCLSDVYAMGGEPLTALSVLCFPSESMDGEIMYLMLRGAMETFAEAGVSLVGGHSVKDEEIKLGFAITGRIDADKVAANDTAAVGDTLVLTKPLGTGVLCFSRQVGREVAGFEAVEESMAQLNRSAADAMNEAGVSACTDVTGFGLLGHLISIARRSGVTVQVFADALPAFDGAVEALGDGVVPGAIERNREYVGDDITVADGVDEARVNLGFDAQTSGGLLMCVPAERHGRLIESLESRGVRAWTVGRVVAESTGTISVTNSGASAEPAGDPPAGETPREVAPEAPAADAGEGHAGCCEDVFGPGAGGSATDAANAFAAMMKSVGAAGKLDERTKELIQFALVVLARCEPCVEAHLQKARSMGITRDELEEASWCATAMGGAPVRMFYQQMLAKSKDAGKSGGSCC